MMLKSFNNARQLTNRNVQPALTFSVLNYFVCGITSLLSYFGHGTPCLLSTIIKTSFLLKKNGPNDLNKMISKVYGCEMGQGE